MNEKRCKDFVLAVANQLFDEVRSKLSCARFLTVLADGSTDATVVEQEAVSVRYIHKGEPVTELAEIVPLESAKATGVYKAVKQGIAAVKREDGPSLIGANFDGASVKIGEKAGAKALLKKDFPFITVIHCVAHKLELSVLDAAKSMPYLQIFEETIKSIFNFYHFSTKRRCELAEIADLLSTMLTNYSSVKAVRWVASKSRALLAVKKNFASTVMHTEDASQGSKDAKTKGKAASIHKEITTVRFAKMLHFMLDLMDIITETSKIFQREKLTIPQVPDIIQETTMNLMNLKQHIGKHSKEFYDNVAASKQFGDQKIQLKGAAPAAYKEDNDIEKLLENAISYLQSRFENFKEAPLVYFKIFNFKFWHREQEQLALFGGDDVQCIVDHYKEQLSGDECNKIPQEWVALKSYVMHFCGRPLLQVYGELLRDRPARFKNILVLVDLMLTLSPSTAECERQFSSMNRIKTALRNRLSNDSLQALMKINCDGPSDNDFDPEEAINKWLTSGPGGRHIAGHKVPVPRVSVPNRLTAPATATATSSQCQSKGQTVSTTLSDAEWQSETEKAKSRSVNIHSSDSESSETV